MRIKRVGLWIGICLIFLGTSFGIGFCNKENIISQKEKLYESLGIFTDTISLIRSEYVDDVDPKDLICGALKGMLSSLDPYSQFMDPDTYKEMKVSTEGEFGGVGIEISVRDNLLTVITPIVGTPAYEAGVKANDRILKIDDETTRDITLIGAVKKLRGEAGSTVKISVLREGAQKLLEFNIVRAIIKIESVKEPKVLKNSIGYIKLVEFQEHSTKDFEDALMNLENQNIKGLILDLRNNPGGLLNVAVEISDFFLPEGKEIVSTKARDAQQNLIFKSRKYPAHLDYPMVVLVNEGSASGSEIVAGALRDNKRAILLGTKTFGKGSVQTVIPLPDDSAVRLTTSKYYLPNGECIHEQGIVPDVEVKEDDYVVRKEDDSIFDHIEESEVVDKKEEVYDVQLDRAVDLLKGLIAYKEYFSAGEEAKN
ncbi:MAG: S41 family peptidase [Candidatus Omnitrophota bacterium]